MLIEWIRAVDCFFLSFLSFVLCAVFCCSYLVFPLARASVDSAFGHDVRWHEQPLPPLLTNDTSTLDDCVETLLVSAFERVMPLYTIVLRFIVIVVHYC